MSTSMLDGESEKLGTQRDVFPVKLCLGDSLVTRSLSPIWNLDTESSLSRWPFAGMVLAPVHSVHLEYSCSFPGPLTPLISLPPPSSHPTCSPLEVLGEDLFSPSIFSPLEPSLSPSGIGILETTFFLCLRHVTSLPGGNEDTATTMLFE